MREYGRNDREQEDAKNILPPRPPSAQEREEQERILHRAYSCEDNDGDESSVGQTSGEDTAGHHQHTSSWSGVLTNFAADILGDDNSHSNRPTFNSARPPPPPRPPARRQTVERDYHLKNQKFLQQAAAQKAARARLASYAR